MNNANVKLDGRTTALTALALAMLVALVVAWRVDAVATSVPPDHSYTITVVDETGDPLPGATVSSASHELVADQDGSVEIELNAPELFIIAAPEMIPDAVVVGSPDQTAIMAGLLAEVGPTGPRTVMHFGGDFMLGRRYQQPDSENTMTAVDERTARGVISDIAPLFALADLSSVNFESVIGTLAANDAYPGKRYLLQSPPYSVAALDELGVDFVALGNNHINDWREAGVASTIRNLEQGGIAHAGGDLTAPDAAAPAILKTPHATIGMISMTTLSGDLVNDELPSATAPMPAALPEEDRWQYELRSFGFGREGEPTYIPISNRRPGTMWDVFTEIEARVSAAEATDVWQAMARTYPELQDLVARRGHGGAAQFDSSGVAASIAAAHDQGADLVVVQLHGGLPFAELGSQPIREAARTAIDAGADLVIGHHPHVLQGFEFYEGALVAHSLGNLVFDQNFLVAHPSVILRTVYESDRLVEAKLFPVMIDRYRPVPVGGKVARRILATMDRASRETAVATRLPDRSIGTAPTDETATAQIVLDAGRGLVVPIEDPTTTSFQLAANVPTPSPSPLVLVDQALSSLYIGQDVFGFGDFEDVQADRETLGGLEWVVPPESVEIDPQSPAGPWTVRLDRTSQHLQPSMARSAARIPTPEHRWFNESGVPSDGSATYSIRVWGRWVGGGSPFLRLSYYEFDDTSLTSQPQTSAVETVDIEIPMVNDGEWREIWLDLPPAPGNVNTALVGVGLAPPESQSGTVWYDGLQVIEWRHAGRLPIGTWALADYLRSPSTGAVELVTP
jgi:poly-gamma-glutamate capsule biosynthesis protein CapA/YwtB (metallophosphatase superfamily)